MGMGRKQINSKYSFFIIIYYKIQKFWIYTRVTTPGCNLRIYFKSSNISFKKKFTFFYLMSKFTVKVFQKSMD